MFIRLAWNHLWREKVNKALQLLAVVLALSIICVSSIMGLTKAINSILIQNANVLLGADKIIESNHKLPSSIIDHFKKLHFPLVQRIEFLSMASALDRVQLSNIIALKGPFPLRGTLIIDTPSQKGMTVNGAPKPGEVWVHEKLLYALNRQLNDSLTIGNQAFKITAIVRSYPVATSAFNLIGPFAYVNEQDLNQMGVLQPGSRVTYQLLLAGNKDELKAIDNFFQENKYPDVRIISPQSGRSAINTTWEKAQRYISLIVFIQIILGCLAVGLAAQQYARDQQRTVAIWRTFGASNYQMIGIPLLGLIFLIIIISVIGLVFSACIVLYIIHNYFSFASSIDFPLAGLVKGALITASVVLAFILPAILALMQISPKHILMRYEPALRSKGLYYFLSVAWLGVLWLFFMQGNEIVLRFGIQMGVLTLLFLAFAYLLWQLLQWIHRHGKVMMRFSLSYLIRHRWQSITQWTIFTLIMTLLLLIQIIEQDFLQLWKKGLSEQAPNYFLINIQPDQKIALTSLLAKHNINGVIFYPIVSAKLIKVNEESREYHRSLNVTWMETLPLDNMVLSGTDWTHIKPNQSAISIEQTFAKQQNVTLGDMLTFQIGDTIVRAPIVQIRQVQWETFKPNFFVIFPMGLLQNVIPSYITSFYVPPSQKSLIYDITKNFVEVSIIDIDALLIKIREVVGHITFALKILLAIIFVFALLIMYSSILYTMQNRLKENALLALLGATRITLAKIAVNEFLILGFLTGIFSVLGAYFLSQDLARNFFFLPFNFSAKWVLLGMVYSIGGILFFGLLGVRKVFNVSPLYLLRQIH